MLYSLDKESITVSLIVISLVGGTVNYCIELTAQRLPKQGVLLFFSQVLVSGFTGFLGGLLCIEYALTPVMTLFISGLSGTVGSSLLNECQYLLVSFVKSLASNIKK